MPGNAEPNEDGTHVVTMERGDETMYRGPEPGGALRAPTASRDGEAVVRQHLCDDNGAGSLTAAWP